MAKSKKPKDFISQPVYPGGKKAMFSFIKEHLKYPESAFNSKISGTVSLKYDINYRGKVIDVKVVSGIHPDCDAEAIRVVKLLKFNVSKQHGIKVTFHKSIQIHFHLPAEPSPPQNATSIQYHLKKKDKDTTSFNYSVQFKHATDPDQNLEDTLQ